MGDIDKSKKTKKIVITSMIVVVLIAAWVFIVKYGIDTGKAYIDSAMSKIEMRSLENHQSLVEENSRLTKEIQTLNGDIETLRNDIATLNEDILLFSLEVGSLKSSIDVIDTSISSSVEIQTEIGKRISTLEQRLVELKNSLNILLEAPNE